MMKIKKVPWLIISLVVLSILVPITFSKYTDKVIVSNVNLSVIAPKFWDESSFVTGGFKEGTFAIKTNTESTLVMEAMGQSGANERIKIPLEDIQTGIYQLSFTVEMTGDNITVVDNTKYVYGCTIDGNEALTRDSGFIWKSITPTQKEDVCLTFEITQQDIASNTPKYWIWNFGNICDSKLFTLNLSNIKITKSDAATSPYIDFPNTEILYLDNVANATVSETAGLSSFVTTASYDELLVKVETIGGCEHFVIPIKGLTANETYTIYFDELTTGTSLRNDDKYDYGAWVGASKENIVAKNILYTNGTHYTQAQFPHYCVSSIGTANKNNSFTFTATSSQMYWIWEYASFGDGDWAKIHISNAKIEKTTSTASVASVLSNRQETLTLPENSVLGNAKSINSMPDVVELNKQAEIDSIENTEFYAWLVENEIAKQIVMPDELENLLKDIYVDGDEINITLTPIYKNIEEEKENVEEEKQEENSEEKIEEKQEDTEEKESTEILNDDTSDENISEDAKSSETENILEDENVTESENISEDENISENIN